MSDVIMMGDYQLTMRRLLLTMPTALYKSKLSEIAEKVAECEHSKLIYLEHGKILKCEGCGDQVDIAWAFIRFVEQYRQMLDGLEFKRRSLEADIQRGVTLRAAQKIEDAWRRRRTVPSCPHCHKAILPDHSFGNNGVGSSTETAKQALPIEYVEVQP